VRCGSPKGREKAPWVRAKVLGPAALPKEIPHGVRVGGEAATLLVTLAPAGAEYFFVPRDDGDADPARFGLSIVGPLPSA